MDDAAGEEEETMPPHHLGTHGQRPGHPALHAFFLAAGPGVRRGLEPGVIRSRDVAPTIATMLELAMGTTDGRVLEEILA